MDSDGKKIDGQANARFLAYAEDLENLRPAADHDFLARLASAGGGSFHLAGCGDLQRGGLVTPPSTRTHRDGICLGDSCIIPRDISSEPTPSHRSRLERRELDSVL